MSSPNLVVVDKEAVRERERASVELERRTRRMMLMAASSGDPQQLRRGDILLGAPAHPPVAPGEVVIDISHGDDDDALERGGVTELLDRKGSALHVVAAAGDGRRYLDSATVIYGRARHLLTARNGKGDTPLHCAARAGNTVMVARLIKLAAGEDEARALVDAQNDRGETALHDAVRLGDTEMVGALLDVDRDLAAVAAKDGTSPMYLASSMGRLKLARELHRRGDRISYSGPDGQNALHAAVIHNKVITKWLLQWDKDLVNQTDINGSTPMHFAASASADPSSQFTNFVFTDSNIERHFSSSNLVPQRSLTGVYSWRELPLPKLLDAEPSLAFQPDIHGSFPVHVAASADSMVSIIVLLTRYPGCAGLLDGHGRTFLHVAVAKKRLHVVKFVCHCARSYKFKPVVNVQDKDGNTALHMAVADGDVGMFRCLIRNRHVKINLQNNQGNTPMDLALGKVHSGFYFGLTAPRRILGMLNLVNAQTATRRRDQVDLYQRLNDEEESKKITEFAQIVGVGSVLVATATFAAAFTMPGGVRGLSDASADAPAGTPVLAGGHAFHGFVMANALAFICSTLATFSLIYCGVDRAVDLQSRFKVVNFALALLLCAARSFCAAFAFSLYLLLAPVEHGTVVTACVITSLALLDVLWFLVATFRDITVLLGRRGTPVTLLKLVTGIIASIIHLFGP